MRFNNLEFSRELYINSLPLIDENDDAASASLIENDCDGTRGVDCDLRNKDFDGGGTNEDDGASMCDGAGPSNEDTAGASDEGSGASELDDACGGSCDEDGGASELGDAGGGVSDEDGGGVSDEEDVGGFLESSIVKENTLNQRKTFYSIGQSEASPKLP
ncbi:hypothetical protein TSUD_401190 [Trifolium subterraneum]|uniref:Uncharacterized protein n=1 Tax=Trifolium subterraneum TaxID=3900 RepID=A0A2Z6PIY8_TRISU|nr:hypothetical protein TSUD_401190 [Trifolium subterraneum]